ncbi:MAG: HAMP domain-containing sensor histidine kinase [Proteobacteria bacterium]|nr:HAMP domain-containing sensor histidine kinase [Pseudomonadota bacterium]
MRETVLSFFAPPITADPEQSSAKLVWVVRLRWLALSAQLLSILPALEFDLLEPRMVPAFLGVIAVLAVVNVVTWGTLRRTGRGHQGYGLLLQLGADIGALSFLLAFTGGAWNPLVPILFVHAGIGALLLEGQQSLFFFALLIGCLLGLQMFSHIPPGLEGARVPATTLFPAQLLVALVFWILTAWLSRTLNALHQQFSLTRERQTRIDRLRAVGALAAGLSHEFATPLNTAQLKLSRLRRREELADDKDLATAAEALDRCGEVLRHMAGAPLRPEGLDLEVVEVGELAEQVCSGVSQDRQDVELRLSVKGSSSKRALLPAVAFSQALINLIDNAVESAGPDEPVDVIVSSRPGRIEVSVCDRGGGWPAVVRSHLGQPFVTTKPDGVGLGLYFVHTLAEAVGAELHVEDRSDGGAIARISLPSVSPGTEPMR